MKNALLTLALAALSLTAFGQKISVKKDLITLNRKPYLRIEADGTGTFYIGSVPDERLFVVKKLSFNDPAVASPANLTGDVSYLQFIFPGSHTFVETPMPVSLSLFRASLARQIHAARLLKNGSLDPQAVADFAAINGTPFSVRRQALDQQSVLLPVGTRY